MNENLLSLDDPYVIHATRNARSVQTLIGWIFWDPGAVALYERLGLPGPLGYIAARARPFAGAGAEATIAAFGSISPFAISAVFDHLASPDAFESFWSARNDAVLEGLATFTPGVDQELAWWAPRLWAIVDGLPTVGRTFFSAHLALDRHVEQPALSGWLAVNALREWRGDTHWAIVAAAGLTGAEASVLHNEWLRYDNDWLSKSRGNDELTIATAWGSLEERGLAEGRTATNRGLALRQGIEDDTDRACSQIWRTLGDELSTSFAANFEPVCVTLLERVNETAGPNFQPASRERPRWPWSPQVS